MSALGMMLRALKVVVSDDGVSCLADMCKIDMCRIESGQHVPPAEQMLRHDWLHCRGKTCKFASFESSIM